MSSVVSSRSYKVVLGKAFLGSGANFMCSGMSSSEGSGGINVSGVFVGVARGFFLRGACVEAVVVARAGVEADMINTAKNIHFKIFSDTQKIFKKIIRTVLRPFFLAIRGFKIVTADLSGGASWLGQFLCGCR